jgi:hypothetical protein
MSAFTSLSGHSGIKCAWFDRTELRVHGLASRLSGGSDGSVEPQLGDVARVLLEFAALDALDDVDEALVGAGRDADLLAFADHKAVEEFDLGAPALPHRRPLIGRAAPAARQPPLVIGLRRRPRRRGRSSRAADGRSLRADSRALGRCGPLRCPAAKWSSAPSPGSDATGVSARISGTPEPWLALATLAPSGSLSGGLPGAQIVQRAFRPVARPGASGTIGQQVVPPRGQAAAALVRMKAVCRSLNLKFRVETSRPRTKA